MPKDPTLKKILLIGSGPVIIGQACEFDYFGAQACRALREEGCEIVLLNSDPATVMTDPEFSDRTYIEPLLPEVLAAVIKKEKPDAVLPAFGGRTAMNLAMELARDGIFSEGGVRLIGAEAEVIERAGNRELLSRLSEGLGLYAAESATVKNQDDAAAFMAGRRFPAVVKSSFTPGYVGGALAYNMKELMAAVERGLALSPLREVRLEESLLGWKELELELLRDRAGQSVIVCGIEDFDPMGIHTGDSIAVAPIQTLSAPEYRGLRDEAIALASAVGLAGGASNLRFAIDPQSGRRAVVGMIPRVTRSSALASKATGFPIARVAAKLALGCRLDEIQLGPRVSAASEPVLDYCVVKAPRFDFEKFPGVEPVLGLEMKSVGETMAIGGSFQEALQKALRGLEIGQTGFTERPARPGEPPLAPLKERLRLPGPYRVFYIKEAFRRNLGQGELAELTGIDPWFLDQLRRIYEVEKTIVRGLGPFFSPEAGAPDEAEAGTWRKIKACGFSDRQIAWLLKMGSSGVRPGEEAVRDRRLAAGVRPAFRALGARAGESEAGCFYSTYQGEGAEAPPGRGRIMILGGGPDRIGQGADFDYSCVQAALALNKAGLGAIMVNCNPKAVSTDCGLAGRLYFEPLTVEDILAVWEAEKPAGLIVQCGGQTPLNLSRALKAAGVNILGAAPEDIFLSEDRWALNRLAESLGILQPPGGQAGDLAAACRIASAVGYPVMVRPDFVPGGRAAMRIIYDEADLRCYWEEALSASIGDTVFVDRFLEDALELDVDALCDGREVLIAAVMERVEQAGIHPGDSACSILPRNLTGGQMECIKRHTRDLALALSTKGFINIRFAVQEGRVFLLEANPRASRTAPFVSKATGWPLARLAALVMAGTPLAHLPPPPPRTSRLHNAVKEVVLPFNRFPGAVIRNGAEMRSTGEVMGLAESFGQAFVKAQLAAGLKLSRSGGGLLISVCDKDKPEIIPLVRELSSLGYTVCATAGTSAWLAEAGFDCEKVNKMDGPRPNLIDRLNNGDIHLVVNTISGQGSARDAQIIRAEAIRLGLPLITTINALRALVEGLLEGPETRPAALQDFHLM